MTEAIEKELKALKKEVAYIKEHMVDADSVMTEEDYADLLAYRTEKEEDKLTSHEDLKKELGILL